MPRTKIVRNKKRNPLEETFSNDIKNLENQTLELVAQIERKRTSLLENISYLVDVDRRTIPDIYLKMTLGELQQANIKSLKELPTENADKILNATLNTTTTFTSARKQSKDDEGYLTEESNTGSSKSGLKLSSRKSNRRSRSADLVSHTPLKQLTNKTLMLTNQKRMTPLTNHASRNKFRTPMTNRVKAASADRLAYITPKVQLNEPIAMLRFASAGETVFSLTGSPVVSTPANQFDLPNVNFPISNGGMISLRATEIKSFDQSIISKIDSEALEHLNILKRNIEKITKLAESKH